MTNMLVKIAVTPVNTRHVVPTKVLAVQKYHHNLFRIFPSYHSLFFVDLPLLSKKKYTYCSFSKKKGNTFSLLVFKKSKIAKIY